MEAGSACGETLKLPLIKLVELTVISRRAAKEREREREASCRGAV